MTLFFGSMQLGLIYALLALGVYISFRVLKTPDLSVEGTFTLGVAVSAMITLRGHPFLALPVAFLAGMAGGCLTGLMQTKVGIHPILAGILTMSGLYSVNLLVMGASANVSLVGQQTLFRVLYASLPLSKDWIKLLVGLVLCAFICAALMWFFRTHLGLCIRATGNNEAMVRSSSINVDAMKILALAVSNGCVALSGAVIAQYQGYADISSGIGIVVVGLASVIIGETLCGHRSVAAGLISAVLGAVIYRLLIALALSTNLFPTYFLKLVSACIVALALSFPGLRARMQLHRTKKEACRHA